MVQVDMIILCLFTFFFQLKKIDFIKLRYSDLTISSPALLTRQSVVISSCNVKDSG